MRTTPGFFGAAVNRPRRSAIQLSCDGREMPPTVRRVGGRSPWIAIEAAGAIDRVN